MAAFGVALRARHVETTVVTSGSGTAEDPFILDDLMGRGRLEVRGTTKHLMVRDLAFGQRSFEFLGDAILLREARNVTVESVDVRSYRTGVQLVESSDVTVRDSTFSSQVYHAIAASGGFDLVVTGVSINGTQAGGIAVEAARGVRIEGNVLHAAGRTEGVLSSAIRVTLSQDVAVRNNTVTDGRASGIHFRDVERYEVAGNRVEAQGGHGLWIDHSLDGVVAGNDVRSVDANGIYLCHGGSSLVRANTIADTGIGADLTDLTFVVMADNRFEDSSDHDLNLIRSSDNRFVNNSFGSEPAPLPVVRIEGDRNEFVGNSVAGDPSYWVVEGEGNSADGSALEERGEVPYPRPEADDPSGIPGWPVPLMLAALAVALLARRRTVRQAGA